MNADRFSLKATLLTATAAVILTALQLAGIDTLAMPRDEAASVVQLPTILVSAERQAAAAQVQRLPQMVIVGQRIERATAQAQAAVEDSAS